MSSKEIIALIVEQASSTHCRLLFKYARSYVSGSRVHGHKEGTMPAGFVKVARVSEIPDRKGKKILLGEEEVALWHVDGHFYAVSNVCAHQHFSSLHKGILMGASVTCPFHGWTYDLATGCSTTGNGRVRTFRVVVEGDAVFVEAPDEGSGEDL